MATLPESVPASVRAGDTVSWRISLADYPATDGWALSYRLINSTAKIDIAAAASGADHLVTVAASGTDGWSAGTYTWVAAVTKAAERYTVGTGSIEILPDLAAVAAAGYDTRSTAVRLLAALEAVLENRATRADLEYEIAGRRIKFMPLPDLLAARDKLKREVAAETQAQRVAAGLPAGNRVLVRFGN